MTTKDLVYICAIVIWTLRWFYAERECGRLRNKLMDSQIKAHCLFEFIKNWTPGLIEEARRELARTAEK